MIGKLTCLSLAASTLIAGTASADVLAQWTFETSVPTTAGPFSPEVGSGSALGGTGGTYSNPSGNGSLESFSSNGWDTGDFYQFSASTAGYEDVIVTFDQISSSTGPRDYAFQYSTDGSNFTTFGNYTVIVNTSPNNWSSSTPIVASSYSFDLSALSALDNQAAVYFRLTQTSATSANGGTVAATGTNRVDNFTINATLVPEPGTVALAAAGLGLAMLRRRSA
jgi:hypothetical protein